MTAPRRRLRIRLVAGLLTLILAVLAVAVLLLRVLPEAVDPTWERIQETGVLPVCADPSWPPFEFFTEDGSQIEGFDAELARHLAARLAPGVRVQFVVVGFDSLYDALLAGRCDAIVSALPYEATRTEDVSYSVAYFDAGLVLVTPAGSLDIESLDDLQGRVVGVEWGFVPAGDSRQRHLLENLGLRRYETGADALRALQAGEVEAVLVDHITALAYVRDCHGLQIATEPISDVNYVIAMRPDAVHLQQEVDRVLIDMRADGTLQSLQGNWF
jgi:polar amino acid transport system substrate-binding protein